MKKYFITGVCGFIGSALAKKLLEDNKDITIIGLDNMSDNYDNNLQEYRLKELIEYKNFIFEKGSIADKKLVNDLFIKYKPEVVVNLAGKAGVRDSIVNPDGYIETNVIGFYNILEACRNNPVKHLVYASSSSVYGDNEKIPFSTLDKTDSPICLYAATKKSNELFAYTYSKLFDIPSTGLRFFTVYGPKGRRDMSYFIFTDKLVKNEKIQIFNYGNCKRDYTYIDDIVEGIIRVINKPPKKTELPPYKIYNIGNSNPENLLEFINILTEELIRANVLPNNYDLESHKELLPMQPGDAKITYSDTTPLEEDFNFKPNTTLREGLRKFAEWYKENMNWLNK